MQKTLKKNLVVFATTHALVDITAIILLQNTIKLPNQQAHSIFQTITPLLIKDLLLTQPKTNYPIFVVIYLSLIHI